MPKIETILIKFEIMLENVTLVEWAIVALGIWEALSRVVPTSKTWSVIGNILKALTTLSNVLDRKK